MYNAILFFARKNKKLAKIINQKTHNIKVIIHEITC